MPKVKVCVKEEAGRVGLGEIDLPDPGPGQALIRTSLTTICGSDIHLVDDFPVIGPGTPMGHEATGIIEAVGDGVERFTPGDHVVSCCFASCGHCEACLRGDGCVCQTFAAPLNLILGAQSEAYLVNGADCSLAKIPPSVEDRAAVLVADILSTGFGALERAGLQKGQSVAIFAQGPVGLCATLGAKYYGAEPIIAVESLENRAAMAERFGATHVIPAENAVDEIMQITKGKGVDIAVEALGKQVTFENCCRVTRFGGTVSSVGVYGGIEALSLPTDGTFMHRSIVTTLCPAGTPRLEHLLGLVDSGKVDPTPLFTHTRSLDEIVSSYDLFRNRDDNVLKIAIQ